MFNPSNREHVSGGGTTSMARAYNLHEKVSSAFKTYEAPLPPLSTEINISLSTKAQNVTTVVTKATSNTKEVRPDYTPPQITHYEGASLVDLQGPKYRLKAPRVGGGIRGVITGSSGSSRAYLRKRLGKIRRDELTNALHVCLTYPTNTVQPEEWEKYKNDLRVFNQAFRRHYPGASGFWVLEYTKKWTPHYHLLIFGLKGHNVEEILQWIRERWHKVAHRNDLHLGVFGAHAEWVRDGVAMMAYLTKFLSKHYLSNRGGHTGRTWGSFGNPPEGKPVSTTITEKQYYKIRRWMWNKMESDINEANWKRFYDNKHPRKPSLAIGSKLRDPIKLGDRMFWEKAKSAYHGGAGEFTFFTILPGRIHNGYEYGSKRHSATHPASIVDQYRPPGRVKVRRNDRLCMICDAEAFNACLERAKERGLL